MSIHWYIKDWIGPRLIHNWIKSNFLIHQKGMYLNHDFYVVVGKQCHTKNAYTVTNTISLYKLTDVLLLFICFKLVKKLTK